MIKYLLLPLFLFLSLNACDIGTSSSSDSDDDTTIINNSDNTDTNGDTDSIGNPLCNDRINSVDGGDGFLWKPTSEIENTLVVLFPGIYMSRFDQVLLAIPDGTFESARFTGFSNGARQTWRGDLSGGDYLGRVVVSSGEQTCEWLVNDPSERQD